MLEELLLKFGVPLAPTLLVGLLVWLIKRDIKRSDALRQAANAALHTKMDAQGVVLGKMDSRMDCFESAQHACQLDNAKSFATKEDVAHIWVSVDENSKDIAQIKGVLGKP
ncbi:MAG: hypothetical protein CVU73_11160 [Deltaproteobacteria bacterium HGW-Deltaproteobacteria-8]|jgi:hypothetical protein|nr:MAG: hypothetical protein CVU73_11160 [Deltaproteobacteria bacterium HGW-Deltaproteobacteria-8]